MMSSFLTLLFVFYLNYLLVVVGSVCLSVVRVRTDALRLWGLRYVVGFCVLLLIIAMLYYMELLRPVYLTVIALYVTLVTIRQGISLIRSLWQDTIKLLNVFFQAKWIWKIMGVVVVIFLSLQFVASLAVPTNNAILLPLRDWQLGNMQLTWIGLLAILAECLSTPALANVLLWSLGLAIWSLLGSKIQRWLVPLEGAMVIIAVGLSTFLPVRSVVLYPWSALTTVVGLTSTDEYLTQQFDCNYVVAQYIAQANLGGNYIDNWSFGYDERYQYFVPAIHFFPLPADIPTGQIDDNLRTMAASYILVSGTAKEHYVSSTDTVEHNFYYKRIFQEEMILAASKPVFTVGQCTLYQINVDQLDT